MLAPLKNMAGEQVGQIELSDAIYAAPINPAIMHQTLVRQLANARLGTHDTKERWEVSGGGKKPWRQKGTGRARQGSTRAAQWIGGGTVFGPTPRKYTKALPKKMQRAALRGALTAKAEAGQIIVLDQLAFGEPKTKAMQQVLSAVGVGRGSVLVVLAEKSESVWRSASNLPNVTTVLGSLINVRDLLGHDTLMLSKDAVEYIEIWLGSDLPAAAETTDDSAPDAANSNLDEVVTEAETSIATSEADRAAAEE